MPIDFRANTSTPIRNGDAVVGPSDTTFKIYERTEVVPLPSAAYLSSCLALANRFSVAPSGWNAQ